MKGFWWAHGKERNQIGEKILLKLNINLGYMELILWAQDKDKQQEKVNMAMKLDSIKCGKFFSLAK
jgi:hypothetical protein